MDSLTFIIPAYNDEKTVAIVIHKVREAGESLHIPFNIIVINDASRDATGRILDSLAAKNPRLRVIHHKKNVGYGATIKELYTLAHTTWLFSLPGDYQIDPAEILKLWPQRNGADMLIGRRKERHDNPARLRQSKIYNMVLAYLFQIQIRDVNSVRLMKTSVMKKVSLTSSSAFVDAELVIKAVRQGFRVIEVPITHRARAGAGAGGGKLRTILPTIKDMLLYFVKNGS